MKKIAYIIPGYEQSYLKQSGYTKIAKFLEKKGIIPIQVDISWNNKKLKDFNEYNKEFLKIYKKPKNTEVYVLGFSFGAIIALMTFLKTQPKALILCSISPYFEEDFKTLKPAWLKWWRKNFANSDYSFTEIALKVKSKTFIIVGGDESIYSLVRAKDAKKKIINSSLYIAKGAKHKIGQKEYLKVVEKIISKL